VTFACAGAGLDAGAALACAGAGGSAGFDFACLGTVAGPGFAFAVALGFFADFSISGLPVGAGVAVAPCVAQDCHGQHIALAGSVRSINADTAKGTVNFAFIETLPFIVVSQALKWPFLSLASGFDNNDANPTMRSCGKLGLVAPHPRVLTRIITKFLGINCGSPKPL